MKKNKIKKLNRHSSYVCNISFHIIFITKYRKKFLKGPIKKAIKQLLYAKSNSINIAIRAIESDLDHIHLFIEANTDITVSFICKSLKGYSSFHIRNMFLWLKKYKAFWSPSYYCETIGHINSDTIIKYIKNQNNNT